MKSIVMPVLSKVFKLWALEKAVSVGIPPINRLLSGLATIGILLIIVAMLVGAFVLGALYFAYHAMLDHGLDANLAMEITGCVLIILIVILVAWAYNCTKKLHLVASSFATPRSSSLSTRINRMTNSFFDGLFNDGQEDNRR